MQEDEEDYVFECLLRNKHNIKNKKWADCFLKSKDEAFDVDTGHFERIPRDI